MKSIHGSLGALLIEATAARKVDGVRVGAMLQSTVEGPGPPRYASWVIVSVQVDREHWAEWRLLVGRQRAEVREDGYRPPAGLAALTAEVRGWVGCAPD